MQCNHSLFLENMTSNGITDSEFGSHSQDKATVSFIEGWAGMKGNKGTYEHMQTHTYIVFILHNTHIHG